MGKKKLYAVADGIAFPLGKTSDGRTRGGFAVMPERGTLYSPADGFIGNISKKPQLSISLRTYDGLDIKIHVGQENTETDSEGFFPLVVSGDSVNAGDIIAKLDLSALKRRGYSPLTFVCVSEGSELASYDIKFGEVRGGRSTVIKYEK